jgi:hypothetical protein
MTDIIALRVIWPESGRGSGLRLSPSPGPTPLALMSRVRVLVFRGVLMLQYVRKADGSQPSHIRLRGRCIDLLFLIPILSVVPFWTVLHSPCRSFCECLSSWLEWENIEYFCIVTVRL